MARYSWRAGWWLAVLLPTSLRAQVPKGNGLQGAYYQGLNFEHYVSTRRDATLDFDWHARRPVAGVAAEQFSVRWTGWLVPPVTGHYVLHLSVDDGIRLWLNERLLLDDWRSQGLNYYQVALDLRAGVAYPLRLDYYQYTGSTQLRLAWETPIAPAASGARRSRQVIATDPAGVVVIPTRYLFSSPPTLPAVLLPAVATPAPLPLPPAEQSTASVPPPGAGTSVKPRPRSYLSLVTSRPPTPRAPVNVDSNRVAAVAARLATGKVVTLQALYFEQGKASLLPAVQATLDTLAQALAARPALRLEVQGHTDNQGDPFINQRLSQQRAAAVCGYLVAHGVAASRLRAVGYGGSRPVADNTQLDQRPRNRRVVLKPLGH